MQISKKLNNVSDVVATETSTNTSSRLFINNKSTKSVYLIDTGADVSVIPHANYKTNKPSNIQLFAANGTSIYENLLHGCLL